VEFGPHCSIVTGGESGIGRACALALGRAGVPVALTYFADEAAGAAVVREIEDAGGRAMACQADVGEEAAVEALFDEAEAGFGPVRLLVNSAGLNMSGIPVEKLSLAQFDRVIRADLYGPFLTCRRFVRGLEGAKEVGGRIVTSRRSTSARRGPAAWNTTAPRAGWRSSPRRWRSSWRRSG
jgi:glucose 1-dehydrogenase